MYHLHLTDKDIEVLCFVGGRYQWSRALLFYLDEGDNEIPESMAWELTQAFEEDMIGGHSPFPMLNPSSDLAEKLQAFWDEVV